MSVESMIDTVLMGHRRMIEENRKSTEKFQECGKLIRANSDAILTLEHAIKRFQGENKKHQQNLSDIGTALVQQNERGAQRQLVEKDEIERSENVQIPFEQLNLKPWTKYVFWTIFFSHTMISLIKHS